MKKMSHLCNDFLKFSVRKASKNRTDKNSIAALHKCFLGLNKKVKNCEFLQYLHLFEMCPHIFKKKLAIIPFDRAKLHL